MRKPALALLLLVTIFLFSATPRFEEYKCTPCGRDCDKPVHDKEGVCTSCNMPLVLASTIRFKSIKAKKVCDYLRKNPGTLVLDVRTKAEFEGKANPDFGSLQHAINIPLQELSNRISEIDSLKGKEIIVYCSRSHRSPQASYMLSQQGFTKIINMDGGMSEMKKGKCKR
jgi:rhodanese-related sulfurtransferase/DNA-directed RNA polymerase subunit RPC12/RpoP